MPEQFSLSRSDELVQTGAAGGYVFLDFGDRIDVHPVGDAKYRIVGGECSCPGYEYRQECKHLSLVIETGLLGATESDS